MCQPGHHKSVCYASDHRPQRAAAVDLGCRPRHSSLRSECKDSQLVGHGRRTHAPVHVRCLRGRGRRDPRCIRAGGGELPAAIEPRRLCPGVTDNAQAGERARTDDRRLEAAGASDSVSIYLVGLSDTCRVPQAGRVVPWGQETLFVGLGDATRGYPVGRSDDTTSSEQLTFY